MTGVPEGVECLLDSSGFSGNNEDVMRGVSFGSRESNDGFGCDMIYSRNASAILVDSTTVLNFQFSTSFSHLPKIHRPQK